MCGPIAQTIIFLDILSPKLIVFMCSHSAIQTKSCQTILELRESDKTDDRSEVTAGLRSRRP